MQFGCHVRVLENGVVMTGERHLRRKIIVSFAILLILAMCLQFFVVLFYALQDRVTQFVTLTQDSMAEHGVLLADALENKRDDLTKQIVRNLARKTVDGCFTVRINGYSNSPSDTCLFNRELTAHLSLSLADQHHVAREVGEVWHEWLLRKEHLLITSVIRDRQGKVVGALGGVYSAVPIYSSAKRLVMLCSVYLLVNAIIFCVIFYFRMVRYLFRPLDKLALTVENYSIDQGVWKHDDQVGELAKLSSSLRAMLGRIEADNATLRKTVSELAKANEQLKQNKDVLVRSEKLASVGRLSAGLAHEIGNPLGIIQGYLDLLASADLSENDRQVFSEKANSELDRINRLVRQLLDYSRSDDLAQQRLSAHILIEEAIRLARLEKRLKHCEIVLEYNARQHTVLASEDGLRQIMLNCLINSGDATLENRGERLIRVATTNRIEDDTNLLVVTISDNGTGIHPDDLKNVFDPFFSTKAVGEGTGLGLFVCHQLISAMGGTIDLQLNSERGGTDVVIMLPVVTESDSSAEDSENRSHDR